MVHNVNLKVTLICDLHFAVNFLVDNISSRMIGGNCHLYPPRRQHGYLRGWSARLSAVTTWKGRGAESGKERTEDNEGWRVCNYDATARGGQSAKINRKRTAVHDINTDTEGFAYHSACPFLAPFYSVLHTPELGHRLKSNNLGNGKSVFLRGSFTPSTSGI